MIPTATANKVIVIRTNGATPTSQPGSADAGAKGAAAAAWSRRPSMRGFWEASSILSVTSSFGCLKVYWLILDLTVGVCRAVGFCCPMSLKPRLSLLCHRQCVNEGLYRGLSKAPATLMRKANHCTRRARHQDWPAAGRAIQLLPKRHTIELIERGLLQALADAIGSRALGFGAGVVNVLDCEMVLVIVPPRVAVVFAAAVRKHAQELDLTLLEERQHLLVEQTGRHDRRLAIVRLSASDLAVCVDESLLADAPYALQIADVGRVL